jgi:3-polyprenyl-4-hydroxybenzoate decarboxylase
MTADVGRLVLGINGATGTCNGIRVLELARKGGWKPTW